MNKIIISSVTLAVAQMLAITAFAQSPPSAESGEGQPTSLGIAKAATKAERDVAATVRKADGAAVSKTMDLGYDQDTSLGTAKAATKEERDAAAQTRKAGAAAALRNGEISSGEK